MLPYAPVQLLLFQYDDGIQMPDFLVMTSGNISGAPICRDDREAKEELSHLCDCILSHDRKIRIRADDFRDGFLPGRTVYDPKKPGVCTTPIYAFKSVARAGACCGRRIEKCMLYWT